MPRIVKFCGCAGLVLWALLLAAYGITLLFGSPEDRINTLVFLQISCVGIGASAALLAGKRWAYYTVVTSLILVAVSLGLVALIGSSHSLGATALAGCILTTLLCRLLTAERVRLFFGLAPRTRRLLFVPGWLNIAMGVGCILAALWPTPTPVFGRWLEGWQVVIMNLCYGAVYLALGNGLLKARRWIWSGTIALTICSTIHMAGWVWDTNPHGRLEHLRTATREVAARVSLACLALDSWILWRIWQYRRQQTTVAAPDGGTSPLPAEMEDTA